MYIKSINSRKIIDSGAGWSIESSLVLDDGSTGKASVPGGLSRGKAEADAINPDVVEEKIEELRSNLYNTDFTSQNEFDIKLIDLDGTEKKSRYGGNLMLSLSQAFCRAVAKSLRLELYQHIHMLLNPEVPLDSVDFKIPKMQVLMLEGGLHGSNDSTIQEFMAVVDNIDRGIEIYKNIKASLVKLGKSTNVGAEGAFNPDGFDNLTSLEFLSKHLQNEEIALDIAASSFENKNDLPQYSTLLEKFPIESIEDPYAEGEWAMWEVFAKNNLPKLRIVADDLTATNPRLLREAINRKVANSIIIKPNQIGTMYETLKVIKLAQENNWSIVVSHRGTDTNDDFIADLAVGAGAQFTKFGSPARGERISKYNRLLEIESSLKAS